MDGYELQETIKLVRKLLEPKLRRTIDLCTEKDFKLKQGEIVDSLNEQFTHEQLGNFQRSQFKLVFAPERTGRYKKSDTWCLEIMEKRIGLSNKNEVVLSLMPPEEVAKVEESLYWRYKTEISTIWRYWEDYKKKNKANSEKTII